MKVSESPAELERAARTAAKKGALILRRYYEASSLRIRYKGETNLVTQADEESQAAIIKTILKKFPHHQMVAEEGNVDRNNLDGPVWIVDPLDGTTNFAHGIPMFGISIAFRKGGVTQFGLVHHPLLNETFVAHHGKGAKLNGMTIRVRKERELSRALLATGLPYDHRQAPENHLNYFARVATVRMAGSAALDLAFIACGRLDGFFEPKLAAWDVAAGALLVEEAGGIVSDYSGRPLGDLWSGQIVATNRELHPLILDGLAKAKRSESAL